MEDHLGGSKALMGGSGSILRFSVTYISESRNGVWRVSNILYTVQSIALL